MSTGPSAAFVLRLGAVVALVLVVGRLRSAQTARALVELADLRAVGPRLRRERALQANVAAGSTRLVTRSRPCARHLLRARQHRAAVLAVRQDQLGCVVLGGEHDQHSAVQLAFLVLMFGSGSIQHHCAAPRSRARGHDRRHLIPTPLHRLLKSTLCSAPRPNPYRALHRHHAYTSPSARRHRHAHNSRSPRRGVPRPQGAERDPPPLPLPQ